MAHVAIVMRAIRRQMRWTRKDMARICGVSVREIIRAEHGEARMDKDAAMRLCEAADVKIDRIT